MHQLEIRVKILLEVETNNALVFVLFIPRYHSFKPYLYCVSTKNHFKKYIYDDNEKKNLSTMVWGHFSLKQLTLFIYMVFLLSIL